jgi:hypothetical protein
VIVLAHVYDFIHAALETPKAAAEHVARAVWRDLNLKSALVVLEQLVLRVFERAHHGEALVDGVRREERKLLDVVVLGHVRVIQEELAHYMDGPLAERPRR